MIPNSELEKEWLRLLLDKDLATYCHSMRVAEIACFIGGKLGLDDEKLRKLATGAMLHDVGKILMPSGILQKKQALAEDEFRVIKTHATVGAEIMQDKLPDPDIIGVIRHHHEAFDGSGYPDHLKGEDIPLFARICSIADSFDVLRFGRVYSKRRTLDEVIADIERFSGKRYDPSLVGVLRDHADELEAHLRWNI